MFTLRAYGGSRVTSTPASSTVPASGRSNPAIRRSSVVLPEPDGPSMVKNSPSATSRSTPATAASCPYMRRTPVSRIAGTPLAGFPLADPVPAVPVPADAAPWPAGAASCLPIAVSLTRALREA